MNKYQEALNEMYAVLNDSQRWHEKKTLLQELVDRAIPVKPVFLTKTIVCRKCDSRLGDNDRRTQALVRFCPYCGFRIDWGDWK